MPEKLLKDALAGDAEAMYQLGTMYAFGNGVALDLDEALHWLKKAAKFGHTMAGLVLQDIGQPMDTPKPKSQSRDGGRCLSTGDTKTIVLPGGEKMKMIYCAPGEFMMGDSSCRRSRRGGSGSDSLHLVTLTKGFWLGMYPVTQKQWKSVMGKNPSKTIVNLNCPVESVTWLDCKKFISKVNLKIHSKARFPTEAEWEYACRAGAEKQFSGTGEIEDMGWYDGNSDGVTHPVGKKKPNNWGFHDMHGNVREWCADVYGPYMSCHQKDPKGENPMVSRGERVMRGGSVFEIAKSCSSFARDHGFTSYAYTDCGFRLCCSA